MKKILVAVFVMSIFLSMGRAEEVSYDLTSYFPLGPGNKWVYVGTSFTETVNIVEIAEVDGRETIKMLITTEKPGETKKKESFLAKDADGIKIYKYISEGESGPYYQNYEPFLLMFPAQLKLGDTFEHSASFYGVEGGETETASNKRKITLEGVEDVTVKAGEFKNCLKFSIEETRFYTSGDYKFTNWRIWLAPNIGKIKEISSVIDFDIEEGERQFGAEMELESAIVGGINIGEQQ